MKIKVFPLGNKPDKLPLFDELVGNNEKVSWHQKLSQYIEAQLENIVKERKSGLFGTNYIKLLKLVLFTPYLLCLLIPTVWIMFLSDVERKNDYSISIHKFAALTASIIGVMGTLDFRWPHMSARHLTDTKFQFLPLFATLCSTAYYILVARIEFRLYDIFSVIGLCFAVLSSLILPFVCAQHHTKLRFDPTKHNNSFRNINSTVLDRGILTILESSVFKITIKNVGSTPVDLSVLRLCRLSVDFDLPSYVVQPGEQIELVPETAPFEDKCLRIPGIHCFGSYDRALRVKTVLYWPGNDRTMDEKEHFHGSIMAEFTDFYQNVEENSIVEVIDASLMSV